jgi:hypothetical protein
MELLLRAPLLSSEVELEMLLATATTLLSEWSSASKELIEDVIMVEPTSTSPSWVLAFLFILDSFFSILIIDGFLIRVREGLVGISDLLELDLGFLWIVLVLVWMVFDSLLFKSFLDFCLSCCLLQAKDLVIVLS